MNGRRSESGLAANRVQAPIGNILGRDRAEPKIMRRKRRASKLAV